MLSVRLALVVACGLSGSAVARADSLHCTAITSLPAIISAAGQYCLKQDLSTSITSGSAILVNVNAVTIDLNGFKLGGMTGGSDSTAIGINAAFRSNITIRNGSIRGFAVGLQVSGDQNIVEGMRIDGSLLQGMVIAGRGTLVQHNMIEGIGGAGSTALRGILTIFGPHVIRGNVINRVSGSGAAGIFLSSPDGVTVEDNNISQISGSGYGIRSQYPGGGTTSGNVVRNNVIQGTGAFGIDVDGTRDACFSNIVSTGFSTPLSGCAPSVGNQTF